MKKVLIAIFISTFLVISCDKTEKKEQQQNTETPSKTEEISEQLEIRFSFKTNKEDVFKIMMNNIKIDELQKKNIQIFETVSPTPNFEKIVARFDEGNMSKSIVFNMGNKEVKEVTIEKINITYNNKVVEIASASDIAKFLRFNKYVKSDSTSKIIKTRKVDGKHSPSFSFSKRLLNKLNKK